MFPFMIKTYAYARYIKQMRRLVSPESIYDIPSH